VHPEPAQCDLDVPRDRDGSFAPQLGKKRQRRLAGFAAKVRALYARGLSPRELQAHREEWSGVAVAPPRLANGTAAGLDEVRTWQARPRASVEPRRYWDALCVKARQAGPGQPKAVYGALGSTVAGEHERCGLWRSARAGATFGFAVFTDLKHRGVADCCLACVEGRKGGPAAMAAVVPKPQGQRCLVPTVRPSLQDVPWKERKTVAADWRARYAAATLAEAAQALERFAERGETQYPTLRPSGLADWDRLTVLFADPPALRRVLSTTNARASLHYTLRKRLKPRGGFPNDASLVPVLSLALQNGAKRWTRPVRDWKAALHQFVMLVGERVPM
jgi:transposase-like protein